MNTTPVRNFAIRLVLMGMLLTCTPFASFAADKVNEYHVKAVFLFNFAQFVEWPDNDAQTPITIGILGDDPFGSFLDDTIKGETIRNRKLAIKRSQNADDLKDCHILFISKSEKDRIAQILSAIGDGPVLTVSETEGFARKGGMINFFIQSDKVRFEINADNARKKGLKISSQLLKLSGKES